MWKYINNFSSIYIIQVFLIMNHHISSLYMLKVYVYPSSELQSGSLIATYNMVYLNGFF